MTPLTQAEVDHIVTKKLGHPQILTGSRFVNFRSVWQLRLADAQRYGRADLARKAQEILDFLGADETTNLASYVCNSPDTGLVVFLFNVRTQAFLQLSERTANREQSHRADSENAGS